MRAGEKKSAGVRRRGEEEQIVVSACDGPIIGNIEATGQKLDAPAEANNALCVFERELLHY